MPHWNTTRRRDFMNARSTWGELHDSDICHSRPARRSTRERPCPADRAQRWVCRHAKGRSGLPPRLTGWAWPAGRADFPWSRFPRSGVQAPHSTGIGVDRALARTGVPQTPEDDLGRSRGPGPDRGPPSANKIQNRSRTPRRGRPAGTTVTVTDADTTSRICGAKLSNVLR